MMSAETRREKDRAGAGGRGCEGGWGASVKRELIRRAPRVCFLGRHGWSRHGSVAKRLPVGLKSRVAPTTPDRDRSHRSRRGLLRSRPPPRGLPPRDTISPPKRQHRTCPGRRSGRAGSTGSTGCPCRASPRRGRWSTCLGSSRTGRTPRAPCHHFAEPDARAVLTVVVIAQSSSSPSRLATTAAAAAGSSRATHNRTGADLFRPPRKVDACARSYSRHSSEGITSA